MSRIIFAFFILLFIVSCSNSDKNLPDISNQNVSFEIHRMEQELMSLHPETMETELSGIIEEHPQFMELYLNNIMKFSDPENPDAIIENLRGFIQDSSIISLYDNIQDQYKDFSAIEKEFKKAFAYYQYYFPERSAPNIYTFFSEFSLQRFLFEDKNEKDGIGIGLDLFLGNDYPYTAMFPNLPAFSKYLVRRYNQEHLVKRCMEALVEDIMENSPGNRMLDQMIHNGKKIYTLNQILPFKPDSVLMEYTSNQMQWCKENELEMWAYFLKEDLFYETNPSKINKYINPSPNSPGMPKEAPGRTGNYIGWKIIENYMRKNPQISLNELLAEQDAQEILEKSRYKPRK